MRKEALMIFSLFIALTLVSAYPITGESIETEDKKITAGTTPDSIWYGLDVAIDNINFALTSKDKKSEKGLEIARERLLEVKQMISENKIEQSLKAQERHQEMLNQVEKSIEEFENENSTEKIEKEIELEREIKEHQDEIEETKEELNLKIKVDGELDEETQNLIDSILANLGNSTEEIEIVIKRKKDETKIKIKSESGKTEIEIEQEIEENEEKTGLSNFEKERAEEMLKKANDKWMDLEEKALKYNQTIPDKELFNQLIELGNQALENKSNEEAKDYYEEAKDYAEDLKESFEEFEDEDEEEIEVEIEVKGKYSEIKVKAAGEEVEFNSQNREIEQIIKEISERTGLTREEITSNLEFEFENGKEKTDVSIEGDIELSQEAQETLISLVSSFKGIEGEFELELEVTKDGNEIISKAEIEEGYLTEEQQNLWKKLQEQVELLVKSAEEENLEVEIEIEHEFEVEDEDDDEDEEEDEEDDEDDSEEEDDEEAGERRQG